MPREEEIGDFPAEWLFFLWHIFSESKLGICQSNKTQLPHCLTEFQWWIKGESTFDIIIFPVTTTLNLFITNCIRSWQWQITGENEEILLPEPFSVTKSSFQVNLLDLTHTKVMVFLFREEEEVLDLYSRQE